MAESCTRSLQDYVERALELLQRDAPLHFDAARSALGGRAAAIRVHGLKPFRICLETPPRVAPGEIGDIDVGLSTASLDALLRGEHTLEEAIEGDHLRLRAELASLVCFLEALRCWLHGALRCPRLADLHAEYLERAGRVPGGEKELGV